MGIKNPELIEKAVELKADLDANVRLQLVWTLGEWTGKASADALGDLTISDANNPYFTAAIMSSINQRNLKDVLNSALSKIEHPASGRLVGELLGLSVAFENQSATLTGLEAVLSIHQPELQQWKWKTVAELFDALQRRGLTLEKLVSGNAQRGESLLQQVNDIVKKTLAISVDPNAKESARMAAIPLLARNPKTRSVEISKLSILLTPQTPPAVQAAAVLHLGSLPDETISTQLLEGYRSEAQQSADVNSRSECRR